MISCEALPVPHLPTREVVHIAAGKLSREVLAELKHCRVEVLFTQRLHKVEHALQRHADLAICPLMNKRILLDPSSVALKESLISFGYYVIMTEKEVSSPYPSDCLLNFIQTNSYLINSKHSFDILDGRDHSQKTITVNQGYIKCSVAPVAENAIITDDAGIHKVASQQGIDTCLLSKGDVFLNGYPYGFIGGSCGMISHDVLAFCGDIKKHRDYDKLHSFLMNYGIHEYILSNQKLTDVGSMIPLTQRKDVVV